MSKGSRTVATASLALEKRLADCAEAQLGLFTATEAAACGVDSSALRRRIAAGLLTRPFRGVYRTTAIDLAHVGALERQLTLAACLAVPDSAVGGLSAGFMHGFPLGRFSRPPIPVLEIRGDRVARMKGIVCRRSQHPLPSQPWHSGRILTVGATIVSMAGLVDESTLHDCLDHALARRTTSISYVWNLVLARPVSAIAGRAALLRALTARSDGKLLHRSKLERRVLRWILTAGLAAPVPNFVVVTGSGPGVEVDFAWPKHRVALEVSPFHTHGSEAAQQRDAERRRLLVRAGWRVIEVTDAHLLDIRCFWPVVDDLRLLLVLAVA